MILPKGAKPTGARRRLSALAEGGNVLQAELPNCSQTGDWPMSDGVESAAIGAGGPAMMNRLNLTRMWNGSNGHGFHGV